MKNSKKQKGFSLIEFIVYLAVATVVLVALGRVALPLFQTNSKTTSIEEVAYNGKFALKKINSWVRRSDEVRGPQSGNASSSVSIAINPGSDTTVIQFREKDGRIEMKKQGDSYFITSDEVTVTSFQVQNISYSGTPGTLRTEIQLERSGSNDQLTQQTFYGTANIRTND